MKFWLLLVTVFFTCSLQAQPPKSKTTSTQKINYPKLKQQATDAAINGQFKEAKQKATTYLTKYPTDMQATFALVMALVGLNNETEAYQKLGKYFKNNTDSLNTYYAVMAMYFYEPQRLTKGIMLANKAIETDAKKLMGYYAKATIYNQYKEYSQALDVMQPVMQQTLTENDQAEYVPFYAMVLSFNKKYTEAVNALNNTSPKVQQNTFTRLAYAYAYDGLQQYTNAIEKLDAILAAEPDNENAQFDKIKILAHAGKTNECCTLAENFIEKTGSYEFLRYNYKCPNYFKNPSLDSISKAVYAVDAPNGTYNFTISKINGTIAKGLNFTWQMTGNVTGQGTIQLTQNATNNATTLDNYFKSSTTTKNLDTVTTVWLSQTNFNEVVKNGSTTINVGYGPQRFLLVPDTELNPDEDRFDKKIEFVSSNVEQLYVNNLHLKSQTGNYEIWVLNNAANPLILMMKLDFTISLQSIIN
jgi:tetratricopeptide (TPR) repeat protein